MGGARLAPPLRALRGTIAGRDGDWALLQYTGLSWSHKGFPIRLPFLLGSLKRAGMNVAIVFHDPEAFPGTRVRDRFRRRVQLAVMRRSANLADKVFSTISPDQIPWMQHGSIRAKITVIPVGSNFPPCTANTRPRPHSVPAVIVFGFSAIETEASLIARVMLLASETLGQMRLVIFGRGALRAARC